MIDKVERVLRELGLIPAGAPLSFNAYLLKQIVFEVFVDSRFYHLKFSPTVALEHEYDAMREAHEAFGDIAIEPLGFSRVDPWYVITTAGVRYLPMTMRTARVRARRLRKSFRKYFAQGLTTLRAPDNGRSHRSTLLDALALRPGPEQTYGTEVIERSSHVLRSLPKVRQHGDLADNNCGFTAQSVVFFDWEDFGASVVPGLDLCVFTASMLNFDAIRISTLLRTGRPRFLGTLMSDFCEIYGLTFADLCVLYPACLLEFARLKTMRGYGAPIQNAVSELIGALCREPVRPPAP